MPPTPPAPLLKPADAAKLLGVCTRTLYTLTKSGALPALKIGHRTVRYSPAALTAFIESAAK